MSKLDISPDRETYARDPIPFDFDDAVFLGNPALDNVVSVVIALGAELWATKARQLALESLLAKKGVSSEDVSLFIPTKEQEARLTVERDRFIELTLAPLGNQGFRPVSSDDNGFTRF